MKYLVTALKTSSTPGGYLINHFHVKYVYLSTKISTFRKAPLAPGIYFIFKIVFTILAQAPQIQPKMSQSHGGGLDTVCI